MALGGVVAMCCWLRWVWLQDPEGCRGHERSSGSGAQAERM